LECTAGKMSIRNSRLTQPQSLRRILTTRRTTMQMHPTTCTSGKNTETVLFRHILSIYYMDVKVDLRF
jgi:hypothetical protein